MGKALQKLGLAIFVAATLAGFIASPAVARESVPQASAGGTVAPAELPAEARETKSLILRGGPFPFPKDGAIFGNRESLLPKTPRGYYREYTVRTPGSTDRGARRIVCGGAEPRQPVDCYYTADHYASFKRIAQ